MSFRRLLPCALLPLLAATSLAQLTSEMKRDVLESMDDVLTREAFVPGVDLEQWRVFLNDRQDALEEAESPWSFAGVVNRALADFGVSHIRLSASGRRRWRGAPEARVVPQEWSRYRRPAASTKWLTDEAAILRLGGFGMSYDPEETEGLFKEIADAKYLILDLRSNPGGEVSRLQHFLGLLLPDGTPVGTFVSRRMAQEFIRSGRGNGRDPIAIARWSPRKFRAEGSRRGSFAGRIAVLVDGRSASASEIVASALREVKGSLIIGRPTAGAVLMSTFERLPHGFRVQYPISDYVSIAGRRLEGNPIRPDVELSGDDVAGDSAIERALEALKTAN